MTDLGSAKRTQLCQIVDWQTRRSRRQEKEGLLDLKAYCGWKVENGDVHMVWLI